MPRSIVAVENIRPGMVIYEEPSHLIVEDVLTTQSLSAQQQDRHPLIVLSVNAGAQQITVTYIASFASAGALAAVNFRGGDSARRLFVPITPAIQEFDHAEIAWASHPGTIRRGWVSVRNKMVLTAAEFTTFDDYKYFTAETAAALDAMITTLVP